MKIIVNKQINGWFACCKKFVKSICSLFVEEVGCKLLTLLFSVWAFWGFVVSAPKFILNSKFCIKNNIRL